jgi:hypothetical protein
MDRRAPNQFESDLQDLTFVKKWAPPISLGRGRCASQLAQQVHAGIQRSMAAKGIVRLPGRIQDGQIRPEPLRHFEPSTAKRLE